MVLSPRLARAALVGAVGALVTTILVWVPASQAHDAGPSTIVNDDFADALPLAPGRGKVDLGVWDHDDEDTVSVEPGEPPRADGKPAYPHSLWYSWTPERDRLAQFQLREPNRVPIRRTFVDVFVGDSLEDLDLVRGAREKVVFEAKRSRTYLIRVSTSDLSNLWYPNLVWGRPVPTSKARVSHPRTISPGTRPRVTVTVDKTSPRGSRKNARGRVELMVTKANTCEDCFSIYKKKLSKGRATFVLDFRAKRKHRVLTFRAFYDPSDRTKSDISNLAVTTVR